MSGGKGMKKFIVTARRIVWHEDEIWAANADAAIDRFMKDWTEKPDYCPSTEVDDELDRVDIDEVENIERHELSNKLITNALKRGDI